MFQYTYSVVNPTFACYFNKKYFEDINMSVDIKKSVRLIYISIFNKHKNTMFQEEKITLRVQAEQFHSFYPANTRQGQ
jgi:hypothetical protein